MDPSVPSSEGIKFGRKMETKVTLAHIFRRQLSNEEGRLGEFDTYKICQKGPT